MPEGDNFGNIQVADAQNFDEIVNRNGKDTFIKFYLPLCGRCKTFAPIFNKLADLMSDEDLTFIKMDISVNDAPSPYDPIWFPTLYWAPKNDKSHPIKYEGKQEMEDIITFIAEHATAELRGYDRNGKHK